MTDRAELAIRQVLLQDADAAVLPPGLVAHVRRRVRRRRRTQVTGVALTLVVAVGAAAALAAARQGPQAVQPVVPPLVVQPGPAVSVVSVGQVKALVGGARLERAAVVDDGAVRMAPTAQQPVLTEDEAVRLWAAASPAGSQQIVTPPVVFLADVTVSVPVQPAGAVFGPVHQPRFDHRLAWVVVWDRTGLFYYCPYESASSTAASAHTGQAQAPPDAISQVQMIGADASGEAVVYSTASAPCSRVVPAHADIALYDLSLPWTSSTGVDGSPVVSVVVPDCAVLGASSTVRSRVAAQTQVSAEVLMVRRPCAGTSHSTVPLTPPGVGRGQPTPTATLLPGHGPTGLTLGRVTSQSGGGSLTYFDGSDHTLFA